MRSSPQSENGNEKTLLTFRQKFYVIGQLGLSTWIQRTRLTKGGAFLTSVGVFTVVNAVTYLALSFIGTVAFLFVTLLGIALSTVCYMLLRGEYSTGGFRWVATMTLFSGLGFLCAPLPVLIAALPALLPKAGPSTVESKKTGPTATTQRGAENSKDVLDRCFSTGKSLATVYLANVNTLADADLMPSTVMRSGCAKGSADAPDAASCAYQCELGFGAVARSVRR